MITGKHGEPFKIMMEDGEDFETETKIFSFTEEAKRKDIHEWLLMNGVNLNIDKIKPTNSSTSWFLTHVGIENMKPLIRKVSDFTVTVEGKTRRIQCKPVSLNTPQKNQFNIRSPQNGSYDATLCSK